MVKPYIVQSWQLCWPVWVAWMLPIFRVFWRWNTKLPHLYQEWLMHRLLGESRRLSGSVGCLYLWAAILVYQSHASEHARVWLLSPLDPFSITSLYGKATEYFSNVPPLMNRLTTYSALCKIAFHWPRPVTQNDFGRHCKHGYFQCE